MAKAFPPDELAWRTFSISIASILAFIASVFIFVL
jgi:hypothetical protein